MHAPGYLALAGATLLASFSNARADEPGKVTGTSQFLRVGGSVNGTPYGFCGMCLIEVDRQPAACFGLHQPPGGKARFTYLLIFKPDPSRARGSGIEGMGMSQISSDGTIACDLKMTARPSGREIKVDYLIEGDAQSISKEQLVVGGKDSGKDGPRVFLIDLADDKATCQPVKVLPTTVPDFGDEETWGEQVQKALQELREKSPEVKAFFK
jgi:hypothetical protein